MNKNQIAFVLTVLLMAVSAACAQNPREAVKTSASSAASPTSTSSCAPLKPERQTRRNKNRLSPDRLAVAP